MSGRRGFTYLELMMVLTIISILAAIAVPNFLEAQIRASVSRSKSELLVLKMALEAYRADHRAYPPNKTPGAAGPGDLVVLTTPVVYLTALPYDVFQLPEANGLGVKPPYGRMFYRYFNAVQVNPEAGLKILAPDYSMEGYVAGLLWGTGPSLTDQAVGPDGQPGPPATRISPQGEASLLPYDPTNGTTSYGAIYQRMP
ncbi:MAG: type II secretion system protein [Candidatus Sumerlaeota bacterium]|nr:type II secretion system protein [Candidatus Sumerlaeota bacterium]